MSSMSSTFARFFRRGVAATNDTAPTPVESPDRTPRRSSGFAEFMRRIKGQESLSILDLGSTSPANISFLTELGHKVYNEDVLQGSLDPTLIFQDADGKPAIDVH